MSKEEFDLRKPREKAIGNQKVDSAKRIYDYLNGFCYGRANHDYLHPMEQKQEPLEPHELETIFLPNFLPTEKSFRPEGDATAPMDSASAAMSFMRTRREQNQLCRDHIIEGHDLAGCLRDIPMDDRRLVHKHLVDAIVSPLFTEAQRVAFAQEAWRYAEALDSHEETRPQDTSSSHEDIPQGDFTELAIELLLNPPTPPLA